MEDKKFQLLSKPQQDVVLKIAAEAERQGVNPKLAIAIAEAETGGKFTHYDKDGILTSPAGAQGLMQLLPSTVKLYNEKMNAGIDPENEDSNIKGGVFILKDLLTKYKSPRNAVNLYNASPKANETFLKLYKTDPDAAILSLPEETRNYALRVSKNFNLDDDNETGLFDPQGQAEQPKQDNPNNPFAVGVPLADKVREATGEEETTNKVPTTTLEKASALFDEVDPTYGAVAGAIANVGGAKLVKPPLTSAEIASLEAEKKLELNRLALRNVSSYDANDLEDAYKQNQGRFERLKNEQRLAQERLKGIPKAPPVIDTPAPFSPFPQVTREGRASGPKVEGDSGTRNWMIQEAGQQHQLPEVILDAATGKSKDSPTGGKALIDQDLANLETKKRLGLGDYGLITLPSGVQLDLPPTTVAERQADIDKQNQANQAEVEQRAEQARIQQETQNRLLEQQRMMYEAELARLNQERVQLGQQQNAISGELKNIKPLKKAVTTSEQAAELARYKAQLKAQNPTTTKEDVINKGKTLGRTVTGGLAGYYGVMSVQEALRRFNAGDTSEGVLQTLAALSSTAALVPPVNPKLSGLKKAGTLGALGFAGRDIYKRLTQEPPAQ
jgi:hypothetical protein